jgi:hypothetical protein
VRRGLLAAALALVLAVPATATTSARRFSGRTAEDMPISFRLSSDGRRIDRVALGYFGICDEEIALAQTERRDAPAPVAADGTFTVRVGASVTIRGRITGRRASGTLTIRIGAGPTLCVTPNVPWSARG